MRKWLVFLASVAIGCSSDGTPNTTGRPTTGTSGSGGAGGSSGDAGSGGTGGGGTAGSGATGGSTGGSGNTGGTGGSAGSAAGAGGSGGSGGSGGATGGAGGSASPDGGPDASGGSGGGVDASLRDVSSEELQACSNFADVFCTRLQACSTFVMSVLYGDVATCKERWTLSCLPNFNVPGTSASVAKTNGCAPTLPGLSCDKFLLGDFGTACTPSPGTIAQGGACGDDAQCVSTFCARTATSICGTCQPATSEGSPCVQGSCSVSTNTVCPAGTSTCVKPKAGQAGDDCVGQEECDVGHQVGCNTATKRCVALTLTPAGGTCGATGLTSIAVCNAGGTCSRAIAGTCTPAAADGENCSTAETGAHCMQPAKCVGGKCVIPDPSTCK